MVFVYFTVVDLIPWQCRKPLIIMLFDIVITRFLISASD
jgi:hypothetical protein